MFQIQILCQALPPNPHKKADEFVGWMVNLSIAPRVRQAGLRGY